MANLGEIFAANFFAIVYSLFNVVSVTAIVVVNKMVFHTYHFHFPITLVCIHTIVTYVALRGASFYGVFEMKSLPMRPRVILAASFVFYNCASLINLNINTIGFYQISKILVTPTVMVLDYFALGKVTTPAIKASVALMLVGVTFATVTDVDVTTVGFVVGMTAVVGAAQQQLLIGEMQKKLQASANQLLVAYTPIVVAMLACTSPIELALKENREAGFQSYRDWMDMYLTPTSAAIIFLSGCFGLLVSLSTFLMIGATSALTYNIVGHLKTVTILLMGFFFFGDSVNSQKIFGITLALIAVCWYSKLKLDLQPPAKPRDVDIERGDVKA